MKFKPECRRCQRLVKHLKAVKEKHPDYFCKPVPVFGDDLAQLLIVGLAPGLHGANATGRPFTGDASGEWLFRSLYKFGFSTQPVSNADDDLQLNNCRITNAVKCLPPQNKPLNTEIVNCNTFFIDELLGLPDNAVVLALGSIAHNAVLRATDNRLSAYKFAHAQVHQLEHFTLLDSYHCSRYNTQTKRLTEPMFDLVFDKARQLINKI